MRLPSFLKKRYIYNDNTRRIQDLLKSGRVNTVCDHAQCPNRFDCFSQNHLTFMILGKNCTRQCKFCSVTKAEPEAVDPAEADKILKIIKELGLKNVIITSVTRDDLEDQGLSQFMEVIKKIRQYDSTIFIEILVPDLWAKKELIEEFKHNPVDILGHNIETVERLSRELRPQSDFYRSLNTLKTASECGLNTKSGIMTGLGETKKEIVHTLKMLYDTGCKNLTIGQYLKPKYVQYEVRRYVNPEEFKQYEDIARDIGFEDVMSGPFVRSSYTVSRCS